MTEKQQKRFYFPAWSQCARANDWRMQQGRLQADLASQAQQFDGWPPPAREVALQVLDYANCHADKNHRAVTADDLRHACNLVATGGRATQSGDMTNHETNRVVALFGLLCSPEDLDALCEWLHPELSDKRSLVSFIRKQAPDAVMIAIARNAYQTSRWDELDAQQLKWILKQVKGRQKEFHRPVESAVEQPF